MYKAALFACIVAYTNAAELQSAESLEFVENGPVSNSGKGFDISQPMSSSTATCMKNDGYTTMIARAWHSSGTIDTGACTSLNSAKAAGILNRDVYFFPCPTCSASASS